VKRKAIIFLLVIFFLPYLLAGKDFAIKEKKGIFYLEENGIPYFGWFLKTSRAQLELSGKWRFKPDPQEQGLAQKFYLANFDDSGWELIEVPSDWTKLKPELAEYQGICWYRKKFFVPREWQERFNRLELDGVVQKCQIWINGKPAGKHNRGYTRFSFDVSNLLKYGEENQITVMVDNRRSTNDVPPRLWKNDRLGWWEAGGIAREVKLVSSFPQTLVKLEVRAEPENQNSGELEIRGLIFNAREESAGVMMELELTDPATEEILMKKTLAPIMIDACSVEGFEYTARFYQVNSWSPDSPYLYLLTARLTGPFGVEENSLEVGFRKFEVRGSRIYLNGKPYYLRGLNRHEDDPETGFYQTDERMLEDIRLIKALGVNHLRPAHYPPDPGWLILCDRFGITITEEIPLYQAGMGVINWLEALLLKPSEKAGWLQPWELKAIRQITEPELVENALLTLAEMIERDRNHPSIIIWSIGNENLTLFFNYARKTYQELYQLAKKLDPSRPVTFALLTSPYLSPAFEQSADLAEIISVNEYYGWYFGKISGAGRFFDRLHKKYPDKPIVVSEFGAGAVPGWRDPKAEKKFSEDYQARLLKETWEQILEREWIVGGMPWVFADFRCGWFGKEHPVPGMNLKGIVDYHRQKKLGYDQLKQIYQRIEARED